MEFRLDVDGTTRTLAIEEKDGRWHVHDGALSYVADSRRVSDEEMSVLVDGRSVTLLLARDKDGWLVRAGGGDIIVREASEESRKRADGGDRPPQGRPEVRSPMPGKVVKVLVAEGEAVRRNQTLLIVEAMKMENEIRSAVDGRVRKVCVSAGDLVDPERPMIELEVT